MTGAVLIALILSLVNPDRIEHGCAELVPGHRMRVEAQHHSREMAREGYLFHSELDPGEGEVVGMTTTRVQRVVRAWYRSAPHRRVLRACWLGIAGAGLAKRDGILFVTLKMRAP